MNGSESGDASIDLILFGLIAAFLVFRLWSVLGRRTGFERSQSPTPRPARPGPASGPSPAAPPPSTVATVPHRRLPEPGSIDAGALARIRAAEPDFDPERFLAGAERAFATIVTAFARDDRAVLRPLLDDATRDAFFAVLTARAAAGEIQRTEIRAILSAAIERASLLDRMARITVRFVTDQLSETRARDGAILSGSDAVVELTDLWTFARTLGSPDPNWMLVEANSV